VIHQAMRAAADLRLAFEAHLLYHEAEVAEHLQPGDRVVAAVAACPPSPRETASEHPVASFA
jgi:hypothetical protein